MFSSRIRVAATAGAAVVGAGVLALSGLPAQAASDQPVRPAESAAAGVTSTSSTAARKPNYSLIPAIRTTKYGAAKKGLDFGTVTRITEKRGVLKVYFDRGEFYTGQAAADHNDGELPPNDYLVVNNSSKVRVFTVSKKASFTGEEALLDDSADGIKRTRISRKQFIENYLDASGPVNVWLRHTNGDKGAVTALGEQYLP